MMNTSKLTQKSLDVIGHAQNMASEYGNSQIMQEHLLYALLSQDGGLIPELLTRMDIQPDGTSAQG